MILIIILYNKILIFHIFRADRYNSGKSFPRRSSVVVIPPMQVCPGTYLQCRIAKKVACLHPITSLNTLHF